MKPVVKAAFFSVLLLVVFGGAIFFLKNGRKPQPADDPIVIDTTPKATGAAGSETKEATRVPIKTSQGEATFPVRVLDQATKKLLAKASVVVQKVNEGDRPGEVVFQSGRRGGGSSGEFSVSVSPGVYTVRAQCPGYRSEDVKVPIAKDHRTPVVLELGRGNSISGRVLTRDGRGIGGAHVFAYHQIGSPGQSQLEKLINIVEVQKFAGQPPAEAVSAEDGSYQIDGLDRKFYSVKAIAGGFSPLEREDILPTKEGVDFSLSPGGEITGTVVDSSTNEGIEGAKVAAYSHVEGNDIFLIIQTRSRPPLETVTAGAGGQFKIETLGSGVYNIVVHAKGYQEGKFLKIKVQAGQASQQRFAVGRGLSIAGTVLSPSNEPVAGAKVRATRIGDGGSRENIIIKFDDGSITTDAQGRFSFDTLEPGKYTLLAWHPDYATEQRRDIDAGATELTVVLPVGGAVSGVITEAGSGAAIAGARVSVSDVQDLRKDGITDEKGQFYVTGLSSQGKRFLNIQADGYARLSNHPVQVKDGEAGEALHFELHRTAGVAGRVVNSAGQGVANARVMARRNAPGSQVPVTVGSGVTADDGSYDIKDLEAGEATVISVVTSDYLEGTSSAFAVQSGEAIQVPDVILQLGGMVKGVVVGPDGRGIAGVQVMARLEGDTQPKVELGAVTDNAGGFLLKGLTAGTIDVVAKSQQHLEEVVSGVKVVEANITQDVRIVLKQGSYVRGVVVDSSGNAVREAIITCLDISAAAGQKELRSETDAEGKFSLENILGGETVELTVEHVDHGSWTNEKVSVNTADLKVVLPRLGGVKAVVVDSRGAPIPSFSVQPQAKEGASDPARKRLSAKSFPSGGMSKDGAFTYSGIPPGTYDIYVRAPGFAAFTFPDVVVTEETTDLKRAVLREGGVLSGSVVDAASGRPLAGATVRVVGGMVKFNTTSAAGKPAGDPSVAATDVNGGFEFHNLKGGAVSVLVSLRGYINERLDDLDTNVSDKSRDLKIALKQGAEIFGKVFDASGVPQNGISVYLTGTDSLAGNAELNNRTATNSEGTFHFQGLIPGSYRVTAQKAGQGGTNESMPVTVDEGVKQEVELFFKN